MTDFLTNSGARLDERLVKYGRRRLHEELSHIPLHDLVTIVLIIDPFLIPAP